MLSNITTKLIRKTSNKLRRRTVTTTTARNNAILNDRVYDDISDDKKFPIFGSKIATSMMHTSGVDQAPSSKRSTDLRAHRTCRVDYDSILSNPVTDIKIHSLRKEFRQFE
eukprot:TRINITY_DN4336_c0_g1_i1.p1 TRINITY_DN4336_c0_g1~~TRINITY_DN4336_c0_g1_i1.p1  ORF type:complete len:111 (+),score=12.08 TRINITY_DN4336_c0_g1_i1:235-567(+)